MRTSIKKVLAGAAILGLVAGPFSVFGAEGGPTVTLSSSAPFTAATPTNVTWASPIPVTVTISSSTTAFDAADVSVVGAMGVENFSGSGSSYSFTVTPGDGDPMHADEPRYVRIEVHADKFDGNQASNVIEFWYDPGAEPADTTAPVITMTSSSTANGAALVTANASTTSAAAHFSWTVDDAGATIRCSIGDASAAPSYFSCGSPQDYTLPAGSYLFVVDAADGAGNTASTTRTFTVTVSTTSPATTTPPEPPPAPAPSPAPSGGGGGGGGNGMIVGSSATAPGGAGIASLVNPNTIIPTVPTGPTPAVATAEQLAALAAADAQAGATVSAGTQTSGGTIARTVSGRAGSGSFLTASSQPAAAENTSAEATTTPAAETPAIPNTANDPALQGAAAAEIPSVPASFWVWSLIAILLVAALGWFFYRSV